MVDGLLRFGREKFGNSQMSFEEVCKRFGEAKVFDIPPVGRVGKPEELAMVACLLASPLSGFITGANYRVDGGQSRGLN
jgi:NAD(P)-dependent dehydrogenase (short-subunit alcohol dehydrogenase family)